MTDRRSDWSGRLLVAVPPAPLVDGAHGHHIDPGVDSLGAGLHLRLLCTCNAMDQMTGIGERLLSFRPDKPSRDENTVGGHYNTLMSRATRPGRPPELGGPK
jgi:hypothetical protein